MCISDILGLNLKIVVSGTTLVMNNLVRAAGLALLLSQSVGQSKKASSITHGHKNSSSQSVGQSKKASSITHGHTLVRTATHKLLDNQRKLHQSHMVIHTLVRTAAHKLLDNQRKASSITHGSSYPCEENSSSQSVGPSKKVSSINHTWTHMTVMCINNSLVRSSSDLLVHSQVLVMCHSLEYQNFKLSKLILSAGFLPQKKLLSIYFC